MADRDEFSAGIDAVLDVLREHGDALTALREIDHFAYFLDETSRARFVTECEGAGFRLRALSPPHKEGAGYGAILFHKDVPDEDVLLKITALLADFARSCGGDYDGWETRVVT